MTNSATSWIENEDRACREARVARLEWLARNYPPNDCGFLLSGGWLSQQLLEEARYCFACGQFLASAVLGVAFVEQILAAKFYAAGRDNLERAGGQSLLQEARQGSWITDAEFDQLDRVRQLRKSLGSLSPTPCRWNSRASSRPAGMSPGTDPRRRCSWDSGRCIWNPR